ncbi:hypothetical protein OF387_01785 [Lentilactobacillus hilgardii]|nr:hypothetical protein [Lentilactobacillus hilgardii]MCV3739947.1 hypothetical protein [Lentilactobacillus hilgardii]
MLKLSIAVTIIGVIMLPLGIFSYITATYKNETRRIFVFLMGLSMVMIIGGGLAIPGAYAQQKAAQRPVSAQQRSSMSSITSQDQNEVFDGGAHQRSVAKRHFAENTIKKQLNKDYRKLGTGTLDRHQRYSH